MRLDPDVGRNQVRVTSGSLRTLKPTAWAPGVISPQRGLPHGAVPCWPSAGLGVADDRSVASVAIEAADAALRENLFDTVTSERARDDPPSFEGGARGP